MPDPVLPLYLNLRETEVLSQCVSVMTTLDSGVLLREDLQAAAEDLVRELERSLGTARERLPVLRSLQTALVEHGWALARSGEEPAGEDH